MKAKISYCLTIVLVLLMQVAFGQEQTKSVSGTVIDQNGLPLPGVNLSVEGTTQGTVTDFNGEFTVDVAVGQVLLFTSVGFQEQSWEVDERNFSKINMQQETELAEWASTPVGI